MRIQPLAFCACLAISTVAARAQATANPNASATAKAVLAYFQGLTSRSDNRVVSGQFTDFGNAAGMTLLDEANQATGHYPGIAGSDYIDFGRNAITYKTPNKPLIENWKKGGLATLNVHLPHPGGGGLRDRDVDLARLLEAGHSHNIAWMKMLDSMAAGLKELKDNGVVVLWRPFHEMNGEWFWWNGKDAAAFIKLWRHMFDYYSKTKGLDNLLWVYGPNMGTRILTYYPGNDYVDMTGLDAYTDFVDSAHIKGYGELVGLGKPFGFGEFGPHGPENPPGDFDYRKFIAGIKKDFPKTCFFMAWNAKWSIARNRFPKEFLEDPWIADREDISWRTSIGVRTPARRTPEGAALARNVSLLTWVVPEGQGQAAATARSDGLGRLWPTTRP